MNNPLYTIRHEKDDNGEREDYWGIYYEGKRIFDYRAKSRSKVETQELLNHFHKTIEKEQQT